LHDFLLIVFVLICSTFPSVIVLTQLL
jgi:hypothetical protein